MAVRDPSPETVKDRVPPSKDQLVLEIQPKEQPEQRTSWPAVKAKAATEEYKDSLIKQSSRPPSLAVSVDAYRTRKLRPHSSLAAIVIGVKDIVVSEL